MRRLLGSTAPIVAMLAALALQGPALAATASVSMVGTTFRHFRVLTGHGEGEDRRLGFQHQHTEPEQFVLGPRIRQLFSNWSGHTGVTSLSGPFVSDGGTGTYSFRARVRNTSTLTKSGYSTAKSITVI